MRIIYNSILPVRGFVAIMLFGVIFARKKYAPLSLETINHEAIHAEQAKECGGYWRFYLLYLRYWVKYGYYNIPFEREARNYANLLIYIDRYRKRFAWREYL